MPRAYIASPLGFSPATRLYYDTVLLPAVRAAGIDPLDPWADDDGAVARAFAEAAAAPPGERRSTAFASVDARLGSANERAIRESDGMLAVLDGPDVDSGTAAEIGFAAALGKPVAGLRLDTRRTGDNEGATVNLQVEHFIRSGGGEISDDLGAAVAHLAALLGARTVR